MKRSMLAMLSLILMFSTFGTSVASAQEKSDAQIEQELAEDFEFIFEEASTQDEKGNYIIDEDIIADEFGEESVDSIKAFVKMSNGESLSEADLESVPAPEGVNESSSTTAAPSGQMAVQSSSYASCVGDKIIDATGIGFITGGMATLIEDKKWKKLSKEVLKVAGKNAVKGGVVGFAATLAWFGARCAF